ncbi:site-2 protease family protein [Ruficoccus amylovorans]|uniref:Zinc metalloprotease n=1 Tax=Ruficoccus amylovorans TaxID=1804625 RepID=A0A842HEZ2_9BACT|nr:site-2 protease family protein [Ruficoccus amylovorans]MBC2594829.1 site-2 protease family protein [Ruficoccus amylovorans]
MRKWSIKLFRLFGIRVEVHASFLLLLILVGMWGYDAAGWPGVAGGMVYTLFIFASVLLHEYGHCFAARRYGVKIPRILLLPIGGMAQFSHIPREPGRELVITLAGPLMNFLIAGVLFAVLGSSGGYLFYNPFSLHPREFLTMLMIWNLAMGIFNLLPIFPMDGGRILRALLVLKFDYLTATRLAVHTGKVLGVIAIAAAAFYLQSPLTVALFAFILIGGEVEFRQLRNTESYAGLTISDVTLPARPEEIFPLTSQTPILQAGWPLEFYAPLFRAQKDRIYPVYAGDSFIGVVRTAYFDRALSVAHTRRQVRRSPACRDYVRETDKPPILPPQL